MRQDFPRKPTKAGRELDYQRGIRHALIRSRLGSSQSARIYQTQQATFVNPVDTSSPGGTAGIELRRFIITSINPDYLVCRTYDGTTQGATDTNIAKPVPLRRTPFHGQTIGGVFYSYAVGNPQKRTLTHGSLSPPTATSDEFVTPPYAVGDQILAVKPTGGVTTHTNFSNLAGAEWEDTNDAGRIWLAPYIVVEVCISGVTRKMVIRGGPNNFAA